MSELVSRLRNWRSVHLARLHILMEEAADDIERLSQNGDCPGPDNAANRDNDPRLAALQALSALDEELSLPRRTPPEHAAPPEGSKQTGCTLTDAEREAIERGYCALTGVEDRSAECSRWDAEAAATLRSLLERMT